jgi:site-specific recombinase XerD
MKAESVRGRKQLLSDLTDKIGVDELFDEIARYERKSLAENTRRAYRNDWNDFRSWCRKRRLLALPARPDTVALYLTARARTHKVNSLSRRLTVIGKLHQVAGKPNPIKDGQVERVWRGILREKSEAVSRRTPALLKDLRKMLAASPRNLSGLRNRAILLIGFAGAMRRSELVALNVGDVQLSDDGFVVTLRRGKTDQTGKGRKIGIPYGEHRETCPVRTLLAWMEAAEISRGALFRKVNRHGAVEGERLCDRSVALIVKRSLKAAGINEANFSGHSLRAGLATAAAMAGVDERAIQDQTGHRSLKVLRTYIRDGSLFRNNAAKKVGL